MQARLHRVILLFLASSLILTFYLMFLHIFPGMIRVDRSNPRAMVQDEKTLRGVILDRTGRVLAETCDGKRVYPGGESVSNLIGYVSPFYGKAGLELLFDAELLGLTGTSGAKNNWRKMTGGWGTGNNLILTLDLGLQEQAYRMLHKAGRGAAVVMDPVTGRIFAAVSSPGFLPGDLELLFRNQEKNAKESCFFNRAFQGLYPPGSTFKLVSGTLGLNQDSCRCFGYVSLNGRKLSCTGSHGMVDFNRAMAISCNTFFINGAEKVGARSLEEIASAFGFNQEIPCDFPAASAIFPSLGESGSALAESAVGQGKVLASPLMMCLVTSAIANEGVIMCPFVVDEVRDSSNRLLKKVIPKKWLVPLEKKEAETISQALKISVAGGTGLKAQIPGVEVAGKTGTAQVEGQAPHAWFVGYAPAENPQVAVAVVVENGGTGGQVAAPLAKELIAGALNL